MVKIDPNFEFILWYMLSTSPLKIGQSFQIVHQFEDDKLN